MPITPTRTLLAAVLALSFAVAAGAQPTGASAVSASASAAPVDGEVRKVDKDSKKLTLRHGPLVQFDMPAMTMVFQVKDDAVLDQVQPGDRVRFTADKVDGKFTVITLEVVR